MNSEEMWRKWFDKIQTAQDIPPIKEEFIKDMEVSFVEANKIRRIAIACIIELNKAIKNLAETAQKDSPQQSDLICVEPDIERAFNVIKDNVIKKGV